MKPEEQARDYGERIGRDYARKTDMSLSESKSELKNKYAYKARLLPQLREIAGYELRKGFWPTELVWDQSDCWRHDPDNAETELEETVKPAFWEGFEAGYNSV